MRPGASKSIARAVDAASLIICRGQSDDIEVLMGRRRSRASFAPSMYVFPGGMLESADSKLSPPIPFNAANLGSAVTNKIHALALTAIRETFEETGLLLGQKGELARVSHPTWEQCRHSGMVPAPRQLKFLGRAITPAAAPKRFHARFFVAALEHFSGSLIGNGELLDLRWVPLARTSDLPMLDVTEFMLEELARFLQGPRQRTPLMSYRRGKTLIRYE